MVAAILIGGSALVGAGASIYEGSQASHAQQKASSAAIGEQTREYDQTRADYAPWRAAGSSALGALTAAYGLGPSGSLGSAGSTPGAAGTEGAATSPYGGFFESPGYRWQLDQGEQAVNRSLAARGRFGSGATIKAEQRYAEGLAAGDYNTYTAGLANLAGLGMGATSGTAAAGSTSATNISNALLQSGDAQASGYLNTGSSINTGINNVLSAYLMRGMFQNGGNPAVALGAGG